MQRLSIIPLLFGAAGALRIPSAGAQQPVDFRRAVTPNASIRFFGAVASLRVVGWNKDSVALTGTISPKSRLDGLAGQMAPQLSGVKLFLDDPSSNPTSRLELFVPAGARVWAKGGSADLEATGVTGELDLNVIGGTVRVSGSPHVLNIEAMDAGITIDGSPPWLRAKTSSGDIDFNGVSEDAGLNSVSGAIRITGGQHERAKIETITGAVVFAGDVARSGSLDISTHSGPIELRLVRKSNAELDVATVTGAIENKLTGRPAVSGREGRGQEIGLQLGQGGARIYVRSFKGNIQLLAR